MRFSDEILDKVRTENPIEELVAEFLDLKKAGKNYRTLCPFHTEKTPSFYVSPEKGIYHCFGCGKSGNVVTFLMEYKGMSFPETVKFLADRANIKIDFEEEKSKDVLNVLEWAADLYHRTLISETQGKPGLAYFESRKIKEETIKAFSLGYAPTLKSYLIESAKKKGIDREVLERAGLVTEGRDKFIKRIMFPVFNTSGKVIAFTSRVIDDGVPKYMNSPDTEVYKKSNTLYGLYQTRGDIRREKLVILVEGNLDLLSLWQKGVKNVVASLGTSLTEKQSSLLSRYAKEVAILYDSDDAGIKATRRAIDLLLKNSLSIRIILLPRGYDPDSFVREKSFEYKKLLETSMDFLQFIINSASANTPDERITLINEIKDTLLMIKSPLIREVWTDEAAKRLSIDKSLISARGKPRGISTAKTLMVRTRIESSLLGLALKRKGVWKMVNGNASLIGNEKIAEMLGKENPSPEDVMENMEDNIKKIVGNILFRESKEKMDIEEAECLINKLKEWKKKENLKGMREKMMQLGTKGEDISQILLEYQRLISNRKLS